FRSVILVIGSDLDHMMTQGWLLPLPPTRVAINIDSADATKNYPMDLVLAGEATDVLTRINKLVVRDREPWAGNLREIESSTFLELATDDSTAEAVQYMLSVRAAVPEEAVIFADMAV